MKGFTLWFTGLPGAGKSLLARELEGSLLERGMKVELLDGNDARRFLSPELGSAADDSDVHVRRLGYLCHVLTQNDVVAIATTTSPGRASREENRGRIGRFVEVYCRCDPQTLEGSGAAGERGDDGGDYEAPEKPEVIIDRGAETVAESAARVIRTLELLGYISKSPDTDYSDDDERQISDRLEDLGYL